MVLNKKFKAIFSTVGVILGVVLIYFGLPMLAAVSLPLLIPLIMIAIPVICVVVSVLAFVKTAIKAHNEKDSYAKSLLWRKKLKTLGISAIIAIAIVFGCGEVFGRGIITDVFMFVGMGLLVLFVLAYAFYRLYRMKWRRCPHCGAWMKRLNEINDNCYLSDAQNTEERLGSVDYDVWLCRKCGNTDIYPFAGKNKNMYQVCEHCGTVAAEVQATIVYADPEPNKPGKGENRRHCLHCGYNYCEEVDIPYTNKR